MPREGRPAGPLPPTGTDPAAVPPARGAAATGPGWARHRAPSRSRVRLRLAVFAAVSVGVLATTAVRSTPAAPGRLDAGVPEPRAGSGTLDRPPPSGSTTSGAAGSDGAAPERAAGEALPGIGPRFAARLPADARQALVVVGDGPGSDLAIATLWQRDAAGRWHPGTAWPAHNALRGWDTRHREGDLHSPAGVFTLTAAGGLDPNPGTAMPYDHSPAFRSGGTGFEGEPLTGAFDYVVAIDYNRVRYSTPLDPRAPLGPGRGQGIWVHVDHGGPTHGCVSLSREHMIALLRALNPADHPVIIMGSRAALAA